MEWVAISFSRGSSLPRDQTWVSCIGRWIFFYHRTTWEAHFSRWTAGNYWRVFKLGSYMVRFAFRYMSCHLCGRSEKAVAPHSSTLAWKTAWTEEPGGLRSMGSLRVGHNWETSLSLFTFTHWRRKWQPTPAFLPGESQGRGSLVGCRLWGRTESDTTKVT